MIPPTQQKSFLSPISTPLCVLLVSPPKTTLLLSSPLLLSPLDLPQFFFSIFLQIYQSQPLLASSPRKWSSAALSLQETSVLYMSCLLASTQSLAQQVVVRTVNHTREVGEKKELFRKYFPDAAEKFPYTRKVILAFLDLGTADALFYG